MLIVTAHNVTYERKKRTLVRKNGTSDYEVWVGINHTPIWRGSVRNHIHEEELLRLIADKMAEK